MDLMLPWADINAALLGGFIIGWLICFTGVGGGVLVIPTLTFFFEVPVSVAIGTASVYTAITKVMAGAEHIRIKNVNYALFVRITGYAFPGLLLSAFAVNYTLRQYPEANTLVQQLLQFAVIGAIVLSFLITFSRRNKKPGDRVKTSTLAGGGFGVGLLMGATGVGGGVLIAPLLLLFGNITPKIVVGTSILIALTLSALTAVFYFSGGQINLALAIWMSVGSFLALPLASRLLRHVSEAVVHNSLIVLIAAAVLLMLANHY